jgi:hypothetical protein
VLWEQGDDRDRAVALAREAVAWYENIGPDAARLGDEARAWLEAKDP